jgi:hypothetical protein
MMAMGKRRNTIINMANEKKRNVWDTKSTEYKNSKFFNNIFLSNWPIPSIAQKRKSKTNGMI